MTRPAPCSTANQTAKFTSAAWLPGSTLNSWLFDPIASLPPTNSVAAPPRLPSLSLFLGSAPVEGNLNTIPRLRAGSVAPHQSRYGTKSEPRKKESARPEQSRYRAPSRAEPVGRAHADRGSGLLTQGSGVGARARGSGLGTRDSVLGARARDSGLETRDWGARDTGLGVRLGVDRCCCLSADRTAASPEPVHAARTRR